MARAIQHCSQHHEIRSRHRVSGARNEHCVHDDPDCPHPMKAEDMAFSGPRPAVDWLHPLQLIQTGIKTVTAATFGGYADKREMEAALSVDTDDPNNPYDVEGDYASEKELWFDYIADLGDGFNATHTMARLVASDLAIDGESFPHGRFVILGGDQVYPTASREEYRDRFVGPYRSALPWTPHERHVYAIPGNHDWYDGLTSFIRLFCQSRGNAGQGGRWVGGWRTRQRRSYFSIRLPHDWWIWGIDSQLESDIDRPQIEYFDTLAKLMRKDGARNQKIILVAPEPNWVYSGGDKAKEACCPVDEHAFDTLSWFENRYIRRNEFELKLVIAGDLHHYVRYASEHTQRVTSGGGGAYLLGTHQMPAEVTLPEGKTETTLAEVPRVTYTQQACYPSSEVSKRLAQGIVGLPIHRGAFGSLLAGIYVLFAWTLMTDLLPAALLAAAIVALLYAYTATFLKRHPKLRGSQGFFHGTAHVVLIVAATLGAGWLAAVWGTPRWVEFLIATIAAALAGWLGGTSLYAGSLLRMSETTGAHTEQVFSAMAIPDYKNFLRMHIAPNGELTVHAIGIDKISTDWKFEPVTPEECGRPWFMSTTFLSDREHSPHVIERFPIK